METNKKSMFEVMAVTINAAGEAQEIMEDTVRILAISEETAKNTFMLASDKFTGDTDMNLVRIMCRPFCRNCKCK